MFVPQLHMSIQWLYMSALKLLPAPAMLPAMSMQGQPMTNVVPLGLLSGAGGGTSAVSILSIVAAGIYSI